MKTTTTGTTIFESPKCKIYSIQLNGILYYRIESENFSCSVPKLPMTVSEKSILKLIDDVKNNRIQYKLKKEEGDYFGA